MRIFTSIREGIIEKKFTEKSIIKTLSPNTVEK